LPVWAGPETLRSPFGPSHAEGHSLPFSENLAREDAGDFFWGVFGSASS